MSTTKITSAKPKAAFIDRDGVINEERNYVHRIEDFVLLPGVIEGLALLRRSGYRLVVVTNQAGIARGYYGPAELERLHAHLAGLLSAHGLQLDAIYHCPHHPQGSVPALAVECECRKPAPGMLLQAARELDLDLPSSVLIGDKLSDVQAGRAAGVGRTVIVESGHALESEARSQADFTAAGLLEAARLLTATDNCVPA
jgi:D-glycero-D-manno-heptose 1,7-bisphosphate phosphatase